MGPGGEVGCGQHGLMGWGLWGAWPEGLLGAWGLQSDELGPLKWRIEMTNWITNWNDELNDELKWRIEWRIEMTNWMTNWNDELNYELKWRIEWRIEMTNWITNWNDELKWRFENTFDYISVVTKCWKKTQVYSRLRGWNIALYSVKWYICNISSSLFGSLFKALYNWFRHSILVAQFDIPIRHFNS